MDVKHLLYEFTSSFLKRHLALYIQKIQKNGKEIRHLLLLAKYFFIRNRVFIENDERMYTSIPKTTPEKEFPTIGVNSNPKEYNQAINYKKYN